MLRKGPGKQALARPIDEFVPATLPCATSYAAKGKCEGNQVLDEHLEMRIADPVIAAAAKSLVFALQRFAVGAARQAKPESFDSCAVQGHFQE